MKKLLYNLFFPLAIICILIFSILAISLNRSVYSKQYIKNDTPLYTGLSLEDLDMVTDNLLNYLTGQRENLDMQAEINGKLTEVFDEREKAHMVDVQKLFTTVVMVEIAIIIAVILSAVVIYKTKGEENLHELLFSKYKHAFIGCILLVGILAAVFAIGFDWFWTNFHLVFFSNDLWILDPTVSVMINMFPLEFFLSICKQILSVFFLVCVAVNMAFLVTKQTFNKTKIKTKESESNHG